MGRGAPAVYFSLSLLSSSIAVSTKERLFIADESYEERFGVSVACNSSMVGRSPPTLSCSPAHLQDT
jgi:hypothetical protein